MMTNTPRNIHSLSVGPIGATICLFALSATMAAAADCEPHWDGAIGQPGMNWVVNALTVFDDGSGSGPALYAGGDFITAGGVDVNYIARWEGCPTDPDCAPADLNCDGVVDVSDLLILLVNWG